MSFRSGLTYADCLPAYRFRTSGQYYDVLVLATMNEGAVFWTVCAVQDVIQGTTQQVLLQ